MSQLIDKLKNNVSLGKGMFGPSSVHVEIDFKECCCMKRAISEPHAPKTFPSGHVLSNMVAMSLNFKVLFPLPNAFDTRILED